MEKAIKGQSWGIAAFRGLPQAFLYNLPCQLAGGRYAPFLKHFEGNAKERSWWNGLCLANPQYALGYDSLFRAEVLVLRSIVLFSRIF